MLAFAAIMPHPPESIAGIGDAKEFSAIRKTLQAFESLRLGLEAADVETIIVISPHGHLEPYAFVINSDTVLRGSFENFGLDEAYAFDNDLWIIDNLAFACSISEDMPCKLKAGFLDHGALVPLYHLTQNIKPKVVHLSFSLMSYERHYRYGEIIQKIINDPKCGRVAVIASGELSHRLTPDSLSGFSPEAANFDRAVLHYLGAKDLASIMQFEHEATNEIRECGIRSIIILLGILHGKNYQFDLLSYEGPFGIGLLTARLV